MNENTKQTFKVKISLVNSREFELIVPFEEENITMEMIANRVLGGPNITVMNFIDVNGKPVTVMKDKVCSIEVMTATNPESFKS